MSAKSVLKEVDFSPAKDDLRKLNIESREIMDSIRNEIKKKEIDADVFLGGSLAKGTIVKKDDYDVDIFARFDWEIDRISELLGKILKSAFRKKFRIEKLHGSRDYFRIKKGKVIFEIIPVARIKQPRAARNVTDLSYFHVNYVRKKVCGTNLAREIVLAKAFMKANEVYGAESYINGFSGYAVECLIIYYRTLENLLKQLAKAKERIVIDSEKLYKNRNEILLELNESKTRGPIVLVDPTWKERNVLAALNQETFEKFQKAAKEFLRKPSRKAFEDICVNESMMKEIARRKKAEFLHIKLSTDRQEGDIAGTKMKKFARFLSGEISRYFGILDEKFEYHDKKDADFYMILKSKGEILRIGPPAGLENAAKKFKKKNKNVFVKNGIWYSRIKIGFSAKKFVGNFARREKERLREMGISGLKIV